MFCLLLRERLGQSEKAITCFQAACCATAYGGERYAAQLVFAGGEYGDCAQFALHSFGADTAAVALGGIVAAIDFYALGGGLGAVQAT